MQYLEMQIKLVLGIGSSGSLTEAKWNAEEQKVHHSKHQNILFLCDGGGREEVRNSTKFEAVGKTDNFSNYARQRTIRIRLATPQ